MKEGTFQVTLFDAKTNNSFQETELNGESYVIAEPGNEYYVTVAVHRANLQESWPFKYLRVGLFVDGFDVQYWKRLDFTEPSAAISTSMYAKFWGFKQNESEFRSFVFTDPSSDQELSRTSSSKAFKSGTDTAPRPIGQIRVIIHDADVVQGIYENRCGKDAIPDASSLKQGIDSTADRKFWMQPSVGTTAGGQVVGKDQFKPIINWQNKSSVPLRTMLVTYHTKQTYELLEQFSKQIRPNVPIDSSSSRCSSERLEGVDELISSKRLRTEPVIVDLTEDDDDEKRNDDTAAVAEIPSSSTVHSHDKQHEQLALSDDVTFINVPKSFEILDITNDSEEEHVGK